MNQYECLKCIAKNKILIPCCRGYCRFNYSRVDKELKEIQRALRDKVDDSTNDPVGIVPPAINPADFKQA